MNVLVSYGPPTDESNPYVLMLEEGLRKRGLTVTYFSWRVALLGRYDTFHVHWPETLVRRRTRAGRLAARVLLGLLLVRFMLTRKRVVRTAHNVEPHEGGGWMEGLLLAALDRLTTVTIVMNDCDLVGSVRGDRVLIRHPHYRDWYEMSNVRPPSRTLLFFGLLREYKGIEDLVSAFELTAAPDAKLIVAGMPKPRHYAAKLASLVGSDPRIELRAGHLSDGELRALISESHGVVLPYRRIHNSGALILALSAERQVLVPRTATTEEIAEEVGAGWVHFIERERLAPAELMTLLDSDTPSGSPDLSRREVESFVDSHLHVYTHREGR